MKTHQEIDRRSLEMARRIVAKIDGDPQRDEVRRILLDESEEGQRLRQNDPFCGILTPRERWEIYRQAARSGGAVGS